MSSRKSSNKRSNKRKYSSKQKSSSKRKLTKKSSKRKLSKGKKIKKKSASKAKQNLAKCKRNRKQKGGFKTCSLGYAMVKGMTIPEINNVPGEINFSDTYAKLNNSSCASLNGAVAAHPIINTGI